MDGGRYALIVASDTYTDPGLQQLRAPASDAQALMTVLRDPGIGGYEVRTLLNEPAYEINQAVEEFFADRRPGDLLLMHFSCHGVKDEHGELYFAASNTRLGRLGSTAVAADFVNRQMSRSRSRRVVLLLDCCYAGAFERRLVARAGIEVGIEQQLGGRGRAVITASSALEYAFEAGELADNREVFPSVFTSALVEGLKTGEADRDQDGMVGLDELYDYVYDKVQTASPHQTPGKWVFGVEGELYIARRSEPVTTPTPLPPGLQQAIDSPLASIRAAAVQELKAVLDGRHAGMVLAARLALERLTDDDSRRVVAEATAALEAQPMPMQPDRITDLGRRPQVGQGREGTGRLAPREPDRKAPGEAERRFHQAMVDIYTTAKRELGYNATRFIQMVSEKGGLATARQLLWSDEPSEGFTTLWSHRRLDLTVEAHILLDEFTDLFTEADRERARARLELYGRRADHHGQPVHDASGEPDEEASKQLHAATRKATATRRLADAGAVADGTVFTFRPRAEIPTAVRPQVTAWLAEDPRRTTARWQNDPVKPLVWDADGQPYSPGGLVRVITRAVGEEHAVEGNRYWTDPDGFDLVELADMLGGDRNRLYQKFWSRLLELLADTHPDWPLPNPSKYNWLNFPGGYGVAHWCMSFARGPRLRSELYFPAGSPNGPQTYYQQLAAARVKIDAAYGALLSWEPLEGRKACRIADYRDGGIERGREYDDYIIWFIETQERLRSAVNGVAEQVTWLTPAD